MSTFLPGKRLWTVTTPQGKDFFLLVGFSGQEGISQLFRFHLDLIAHNDKKVAFDQVLGQPVTIGLVLSNGKTRPFNGVCCRLSQGARDKDFTAYGMEVVPLLWLLTRKAQSRIFQQKTVPQILEEVLKGVPLDNQISGTFHPRDYCVQYRETDFNFVSRLMEEEGIYYFFKHAEGKHTLVLANTTASHPDTPEQSKAVFQAIEGGVIEDRVRSWNKVQDLLTGKFTLWDHAFQKPQAHLEADKPLPESAKAGTVTHKLHVGPSDSLEVYDFPGEYAQRFDDVTPGGGDRSADIQKLFEDNKRTVALRAEEAGAGALVVHGTGNCRALVSGHKFKLERHYDGDGEYVVVGVQHSGRLPGGGEGDASGGLAAYYNSFTCVPAGVSYRPPRATPKPFVQGTQTAVIVGPKGEEIFTDKYGRVKVQFFWDRQGKHDADSSCWVRVAQAWAGKRWGASFWPRIGQEVVVAFEEGDPDRPIIVGSVYNAEQMPPYLGDGPDAKHKKDNKVTGVKSNTTPGGVGFNEWRFDDTKGKEEIFFHAERNLDVRVKHDSMERVVHDRHLIVGAEKDGKKAGDQKEKIFQDKHLHVLRNHVEHVDGNVELLVGKGEAKDGGNVDVVIEKTRKEEIGKDDHLHVKGVQVVAVDGTQDLTVGKDKKELIKAKSHLHVKEDRCEQVDGGQSLTVGGDQQEKVGKKHAVDAGMEIHLKAGMKVILEAGVQLTLKGPGGFVDIGPTGVTIQGIMVLINSGGAAGSGGGSSPTAPEDAKGPEKAKEAKPDDPAQADDAKTGQKSAPA